MIHNWIKPSDTLFVRLSGGLGNQMFQYATGLSVCESINYHLMVDTSFLRKKAKGYTQRHFELSAFDITARSIELNWFQRKFIPQIQEEPKSTSLEALTELSRRGVQLNGYWQDPKLFTHIRHQLLKEFSLKNLSGVDLISNKEIAATPNSLSIHVRRGDYVSNASAAKTHGTCDLKYYIAALETVAKKASIGKILVFTDDPEWVASDFKIGAPYTIIAPSSNTPAEDMTIMTNCQHHIIANSTYSWWGAWLSTRSGIKIAPQKWFSDEKMGGAKIIPKDWLTI